MNELEIMREYLNKALQVLIRLAEAQERQAAALEKLASTVVPMLNGEKCINTFDNSRYNG